MNLNTTRKLAAGFFLALTLLGINAWTAWNSTQDLIRNEAQLRHSYETLCEIESTVSMTKDVETGARGFIITAQEAFLEPYKNARLRVQNKLEPLNTLTRDNPIQNSRVDELARRISTKLRITERQIALVRANRLEEARAYVAAGDGKDAMDAVRATANQLRDEELRLMKVRGAAFNDSSQRAQITLWIFAVSVLLLVSLVYLGLMRAQQQKEALASALRELKRVEEMRDSLTAMLVHDLRTPLTTILGPLEMLQSQQFGELDEVQAEIIGMSAQSSKRLLGLVNELLDVSKMEAGQMKVRHESLRPEIVIDASLSQIALAQHDENTARVERDVPETLPLIQADEELLTRVLINLLGNAIKFTPSSGVITLIVRPCQPLEVFPTRLQNRLKKDERELYEAPALLFQVRDTGEGIPAENLDQIFEKFGQVEARQAGRKMSTGLGLTFCKLAVEAHHGLIWADSVLGQGSTMSFTIPLRPVRTSNETTEQAAENALT